MSDSDLPGSIWAFGEGIEPEYGTWANNPDSLKHRDDVVEYIKAPVWQVASETNMPAPDKCLVIDNIQVVLVRFHELPGTEAIWSANHLESYSKSDDIQWAYIVSPPQE